MAERCINTEHPSFIKLQKEVNIDPVKLETNIIFWQDENNTLEFPNRRQIIDFINKKAGNLRQSVGSSRILRTIHENEEENIINNGVLFFATTGKKNKLDYNTSMNVYLKGVYNRMLEVKSVEAADEVRRKLDLLKDKVARAYKDLLKETTYNDELIKEDSDLIVTNEDILSTDISSDINKEDEVAGIEQFWTDGGFMAVNSLDTASVLLKKNIAFLTKRDKEGKIVYDRFGNPELLELESTYNYLLNNLAQSGNKTEMFSRLKSITEVRPEFKPLYDNLINPRNKQLSAQFFTAMNFAKNESSMSTVSFDEKKGVKIKIFDADRVNASKQIFKEWQKNFNDLKIENNLVTEKEIVDSETGEKSYVDEINKSKFIQPYKDIKQSYDIYLKDNNKNNLYKSWVDNLYNIGINVDQDAFKLYIQDNKKLLVDIKKGILDVFKYASEEGQSPLDRNFVAQTLAKIQAGYQSVDADSTFTNIEGNKNQSFIVPFAMNKLLTAYKSEEGHNIINSLMKDPSFYNSHLCKLLKSYPEDVNYKIEGGIKEDTPTADGSSYSAMSPLELEFTKLVKFVGTTRDANISYGGTKSQIGQVFTLVPSDGSTMPTLQVPIIHGTYIKSDNPAFQAATGVNKELNYNTTYAEMLFDLFAQEQIRAREATKYRDRILALQSIAERSPEQELELKTLEDNAVELYDFKYDAKTNTRDYTKGAASQLHDFDIFSSESKYNTTIKPVLGISYQDAQALLNNFNYEIAGENELFELEDGEESTVRIDIDEESKNKLKDILYSWLVNKKQQQYNNWNRLGILSDKFKLLDQDGKPLVGAGSSKYSNYEELALEYVFNTFLYSSETQKLFTGDVSFAGNKVNYQKRAKSVISPSVVPDMESMDRDTYQLGIIRDVIKPSEFLDSIKQGLENSFSGIADPVERDKKINSILEGYSKINVGDGMGYLHYKEALNIYKGLGTYYDKYEKASYIKNEDIIRELDKLANGEATDIGNNIMLPMMKDNHVSVVYDPVRKITVKKYIKNAKFILFPSLVKNTPLQAMYDYMESSGTHHILFESGIKQGGKGVEQLKDKSKYDFSKLDNLTTEELSYEFWGLQSDTPEHHIDAENKQGVQVAKLITQGLDDDFEFTDGTKAKTLKEEYYNLQAQNILEDYKELIQSIKTDKEVRDILLEQLSDLSDNAIELFDLDDNGNFKSPLFLNMDFCKKVESTLNGLYKNRIVNQKMNGGSFKQASVFGIINKPTFASLDKIEDKYQGGINWLNGNENKLNFYTSEQGEIKSAQCLLPYWSKDFIKEGNILDINELPKELRQIIGYRIPTQSKSSMFALEVVGFLPKEVGSTVVLPEEVTVLMGSDFDIDTLYTMIPNFKRLKDGTLSKITDNSRQGRENKIQDIFRKILLESKLFNETVAPLDSDLLKNAGRRALELTAQEEVKDSVNLPFIQTDMSLNNMMGKDLIGIFANYNANRSIAEDTKLRISNPKYSIKFNGFEGTELFNKNNIKGNNIASQISEMLSAAVDNAKELIHYTINSNTYTASVYALILESGHDLTTSTYFMLQPGIVKAYNKQKTNSGINKEYENIIQSIKEEYGKKGNITKSDIESIEETKTYNFSDNEMQEAILISRFLKLKDMKSPITFDEFKKSPEISKFGLDFSSWKENSLLKDYCTMQIKALQSFESYKKLSAQRGLILKNQKIDGYNGNSLAHLEILKNNIDTAPENINLLSYDDSRLVNQKALYKALISNESTSATKFISKYIPFNSPAFIETKKIIIEKLGIQDKLKSAFTGEEILSKINYEILTAINGSRKSPFFKNKSSSEYIKQLVKDKGLYNSYNKLIKEYPFLKDNYFMRKITWNDSKELIFNIGLLQNRSSERLQNAFQELIEGFGLQEKDKLESRTFALNLIRYSYLTKGFQSGFDSFIKYVPSEWLQSERLGYNDFIKEVQDNLDNPYFINSEAINEIISNLSNINGVIKFVDYTQLTPENIPNLPEYIKTFEPKKRKVLFLQKSGGKYSPITALGRKANGKKAVALKQYSGEGFNFEKDIYDFIEDKNITSTGKPKINPLSIKDKGEDIEEICKD